MKPCIGGGAYDVQAVKELMCGTASVFDIDVDTASLNNTDEEGMTRWKTDLRTNVVNAFNGKYGSGGSIFVPSAVVNDGYFDLSVKTTPMGFCDGIALKDKTKAGGTHIYEDGIENVRIKKMRVINKETETVNGEIRSLVQPINIDGEVILFKNFALYEIIPEALNVCVDLKHVLNKCLDAGL